MGDQSAGDFSETLSYKGKDIRIEGSEGGGTITIGGERFSITRRAGMWTSAGVFNHYKLPGDLARHIVDYLYLFTPEQ